MMDGNDFQETILRFASRGAVILTANKRLSRHLRRLFDAEMSEKGETVWPTPRIYSADSWLVRALASIGEDWRLLGADQVQCLWEEVIEADASRFELDLLQVPASARKAREAHELLVEYRTDLSDWPLTDDHRAFLRWRAHFLERCAASKWLEPALVPDRVAAALEQGEVVVPDEIFLVGFDDLPPRLRRLGDLLARIGATVRNIPPPTRPAGEQILLPCTDLRDEVRRAACWARQKVEEGAERVGIVVPDLRDYQPLIERIFREEIAPLSLVSLHEEDNGFNFSLGGPLSEQGLAATALTLLGIGKSVSLAEAGFLLRTPYLGGSREEAASRGLFESYLRSLGGGDFSLDELTALGQGKMTGKGVPRTCPVMAGIFRSLLEGTEESGPFLPGKWARNFSSLLEKVGWPGDRPLDSLEFQTRRAWSDKLLSAMAALDGVSGPLSRPKALGLLRRMAANTEFQPETPEGPIQVVGQLEAAGLAFDHLWVMGLHEEAVPPPARPNPFLPVGLQIAAGMPRADARRETDFSDRVLRRLAAAAPRTVFSYPLRNGDCLLRPSPLLLHLPVGTVHHGPSQAPANLIRKSAGGLETIEDISGPPLAEAGELSGGTTILKDQALCPFRAFAHHRLNARGLQDPGTGIDPSLRGILLHAVLEEFWGRTRSWEKLVSLDEGELDRLVAEAIETALTPTYRRTVRSLTAPLLEIEKERLCLLVREWLTEVEAKRTPFTVMELEREHQENFGGVSFRTRVDRIDELPDGDRLILDYKTGRFDLNDLLAERPLEPQLPIYGVGEGDGRLAGVGVAILRRGECGLKGVARKDDILPRTGAFDGSRPAEKHGLEGWPSLLERWRAGLESLGQEFARGAAAVAPVDLQKACRYCDLGGFCRIDEASQPPRPEEGDEE